ncbi:MAG: sensor histidine kinase [Dehalococcoidales bacterium]|nr:sensor histidine kinase [Dehalococcoidales bacterium]
MDTLESISEIIGQGLYRFDIEDRIRSSQNKLRQSEEELRALSRRLVETQEIERRTIARELHDEIGQSLTALRILLFQISRQSDKSSNEYLDEAKTVISDLMKQVRELSLKLRPSMLDDLGLVPTLIWHFERFKAQTSIQIKFYHDGLNAIQDSLTPEINTAIYRIVQEALTNIARYAEVDSAEVTINVEKDILRVCIEDRGRGFSPERLDAVSSTGLSGMRERVRLLDGKLNIVSSPAKGTRITAELPLHTPCPES